MTASNYSATRSGRNRGSNSRARLAFLPRETSRLLPCERCGRPRPGVSTADGDARPVGNPECGECGRGEFRAVGPSDFPAVVAYADDPSTLADEMARYGDDFARYADDLLRYADDFFCYADDFANAVLTLPPV